MTRDKFIVIWNHKGVEHWESFEFRMIAELRMIQLEAFGIITELKQIDTWNSL